MTRCAEPAPTPKSQNMQVGPSVAPAVRMIDTNHELSPIRILLAEDDDDLRTALARLLAFDGYEVRSVRNGAEMLDVLAGWIVTEDVLAPTDVIVTDVRMPGFDGLNIVEGLRATGWERPIVVMTAFADETTRQRIVGLKDVVFLPKPFDPQLLETLLVELVGRPTA